MSTSAGSVHSGHSEMTGSGSARECQNGEDGTESSVPEFVDITIVLPDGQVTNITVEYVKQMMDLLIQVTLSNKLSPARHTLAVYNEETGRQVDYLASQTIGSLNVNIVYLVDKKKPKEKPMMNTFEKTQRLLVNLPRNQKMLSRVNPTISLAEVYKMVCEEKKLDPYKYELRHPTQPDQPLNMACSLKHYKLSEITVVNISGHESRSRSSSHLSVSSSTLDETSYQEPPPTTNHHREDNQSSYMPGMSEKKKKNKFLSLFSRKKAFKPNNDLSYTDGVAPQRSHTFTASSSSREANHYSSTPQLNQPQQLSVHNSSTIQRSTSQNNNVSKTAAPAKPPRKKRHAPPPPGAAKTVDTVPELSVDIAASAPNMAQAHSRTSSHSSGFESASSPLESPSSSDRNAKKTGEVTAEPAQKLQAAAPAATGTRPKSKKKRAAPPPPGEAKPGPEAAASPTLSSSSRSDIGEFQPAIHEGATSTPIRGEDGAAYHDSGAATGEIDLPSQTSSPPQSPVFSDEQEIGDSSNIAYEDEELGSQEVEEGFHAVEMIY